MVEKLQEDRFVLTTEIENERSRYKITHKVINYSNKKWILKQQHLFSKEILIKIH